MIVTTESYFCSALKRIATILLVIFTLVQTVPAIQSFAPDAKVSLFNPDEEKSDKGDSAKSENKETKDYTFAPVHMSTIPGNGGVYASAGVTLHPSPYVENHTPPPNFG